MPRTFADYMNEVKQHEVCRGLGPEELDALTWRGIVDICSENDLAFMICETAGRIQTEASYSTGTVSVTNGSTAISLAGSGAWVTSWAKRRIQIKGRTESYDVTFPTTTTGTLATPWQGATGSALAYVVWRDIYSVPSDCDFAKESILWDVTNNRKIDFVDYQEFREEKRSQLAAIGEPRIATRLGLDANGVPQIELGPQAPSAARTLLLDYYRSPVKPASLNANLSPLWPSSFEDVIPLRVIWKYADRRGHPRRLEAQRNYDRRIFALNAKFDGGNEMRRRLRASMDRRGGSGMLVGARWTGA